MEGLRYILKETEAKRPLLHQFIRTIRTSKEFTLFAEAVPSFVKNGKLIYRATMEAKPHRNLSVAAFNSLYRGQFRSSWHWNRISIPLRPGKPVPNGYEINEVLAYELGGGNCTAYILMQLWSPSLRQPDRSFQVYMESNYAPGRRYPRKGRIDINALRRSWGKDAPEQPEYRDSKTITPSVCRYASWREGARKARPRSNPVVNRSECGGSAVCIEDGKVFTAPTIMIDEDTTAEQIWGQLLLYAWGHSYFDNVGETEAYKELARYYRPQVLSDVLVHMRRHTFSPYDARSNLAYMKQLRKWCGRDKHSFLPSFEEKDGVDANKRSKTKTQRLPKTVAWAHQETGIPMRTIYHLVATGKLKIAVIDDAHEVTAGDAITLSDDAIEKLRGLASQREKR
ncbi:MAG: hypothetical protein NTU41_00865, partial [Chloroflexi bacterium]|nr:hypothetical protein [Chloroflexota bacterium]